MSEADASDNPRTRIDFGARVRRERLRAHRTQHDLAAAVGLTQSALANIESGFRSPSVPDLLKIGWELDIYLGRLLQQNPVCERVVVGPYLGEGAAGERMRDRLIFYLEMDDHFDKLGIARAKRGNI